MLGLLRENLFGTCTCSCIFMFQVGWPKIHVGTISRDRQLLDYNFLLFQ